MLADKGNLDYSSSGLEQQESIWSLAQAAAIGK
jgi:hypothetical protein